MRVWRICAARHVADALSGRGGLVVSGRWHSRGRPIVYTATHPALAALEVLVHTDVSTAPSDLRLLELDLPDGLARTPLDVDALPPDWRRTPAPRALQHLGDAWLAAAASPLLVVPSAVMPGSDNVLLNPAHPDAATCRVVRDEAFAFDPRLRSGAPATG